MPLQLPDRTWISDDFRWRFSGGRWMPSAIRPSRTRPGLLWFLESPGWFAAALLSGLISLVPIAGYMNLYGWSLATADNLRAGYPVAAPANFDYIGRGLRYVGWGCVVGVLNFVLTVLVGALAAVIAFRASQDVVWTVAIGLVAAWTWVLVVGLVMRPLALPVLQLCEREGLVAALKPARVLRELRSHWDAAWYGVLALVAWSLAYVTGYMVVSFIPFVGAFAIFGVMIPANGLLGFLLAAAVTRYDDAPQTFERAHTNLLAGAVTALTVISVTVAWTLALVSAGIISSHPEETGCFFQSGCHFQYAGSRETIARISRDSTDSSLIRVQVTFINNANNQDAVDPADYSISPTELHSRPTGPSTDCPAPAELTVPAHSRATQEVCFRLPDTHVEYDLHLPWTGWIVDASSTD